MSAPGQVRATVTLSGDDAAFVAALARAMATTPATAIRAALAAALADARPGRWTLAEIGAVADVLNGTLIGAGWGPVAAGEVADALAFDEETSVPGADGLAQRWGVDGQALVARLLRLGAMGDLVLRVAVARWWAEGRDHTPQGWAAVGVAVDG